MGYSDNNNIIGWFTSNGAHIPIMKGESKIKALAKFLKSRRQAKKTEKKSANADKLLKEANKIWDKANKDASEYAKANGYRGEYYDYYRKAEKEMAKLKEKYEQPDDPYIPVGASVSYIPKRDFLDETRKGDGYRWTGKEYTNDEFLEHLEDANWHTEHRMLVNAGLTNRQMEYIKNNTKLDIYTADLDRAKTEKLIKEAKEKFPSKNQEDKLTIKGARYTKEGLKNAKDEAIDKFRDKDIAEYEKAEQYLKKYEGNPVMRRTVMGEYANQHKINSDEMEKRLTELQGKKTNPTGEYKLSGKYEPAKRDIKGYAKTKEGLVDENVKLYKEHGGFARTDNPETEKARQKWLANSKKIKASDKYKSADLSSKLKVRRAIENASSAKAEDFDKTSKQTIKGYKTANPTESQVKAAIKQIGTNGKTKVGNLEIRSYGDDKYGVQFYNVKTPGGYSGGVDLSNKR